MNRYQVNRIGFVNFWLYDEEDFYFYDGKLLLRGTNGSGKTVTMQSFFPLIFDGNKSPERLDPFGSRDRKIEDYLLPEGFNGNENTGYLFMEFFNKETNKYLTIGIGLRAIKNRNCEFWGFSITDNRRIGEDLILFKELNLRIPLTKKELQSRIGVGGEFVESIKDYKKMVNKLLFGFSNLDLYTEYINLLIQVRSPKLSNSTRPSQLTKILSTVLEPLSEDDLRVMADSIEDMNKYKEKLSDLQNEYKACLNLKNSFNEYNKVLLYNKGENFLKSKQEYNKVIETITEKEKSIKELENLSEQAKENLTKLKLEQEKLDHRKLTLEETDLKSISKKLDEIVIAIKLLEDDKNKKLKEKENKNENLQNNKKVLENKENDLYKVEKTFDELLKDLTSYEEEISFDDATIYLDDLKKDRFSFNQMISYLNTVKRQLELLEKIKDIAYKIYKQEENINLEKEKFEKQNDELNLLKQKGVDISNMLLESSLELKESIASISNNNSVLKINDEDLNKIYAIIDELNRDIFIKIKEKIKDICYFYKDKYKLEISDNLIKINEYEEKIKNLNEDLENVYQKLTLHLDDNKTIDYFKNNNIQYNYFYELIEFKENIPLEKRKQIESFLYETGILTSFVINKEIDNNIKFKVLNEGKIVDKNLFDFIKPLDTLHKTKVENILKSISTSKYNGISLYDNGKYKLSILEGNVDNNHELRYIGLNVRENYIKEEKEKILISVKKYEEQINYLKEKNNEIDKQINILDDEEKNFVFSKRFEELFNELESINFKKSLINQNIDVLVQNVKNMTILLREMEEEMESSKKGYYGSTKYNEILEVLSSTNTYYELLKELAREFEKYNMNFDLVERYKNIINEIYEDIDNINDELNSINYRIQDNYNKKQTIDDLLNSDKYKDAGLEYQKITARLPEIMEEIRNSQKIIDQNEISFKHLNDEIINLNNELTLKELLFKVNDKIFIDEYNLHYIDNNELNDNEKYSYIKSLKINTSIKDAFEKFNDASNKYAQILINYAPKNVNLHHVKDNEYLDFTNDEKYKDVVNSLLEDAKRRDLLFNYSGKSINLLELSSTLDTAIKSYDNLISEENRHLFEDLLINNIGSSIRNKIHQSEEWIDIVKENMESMNTSSGLSFSLKWVGIEAQTEDELDTKEIVAIFKKDAMAVKPENLKKMTEHFKSKIKAKEESLDESERNYLEIIKDVLDYRKWFEFKLYFKRGDLEKRELTDREFNKMSGGEKAIAMYVPLFSSIYAKLNSAHPTAPRIIALDEAFAGVDDQNINDAFRILSKLDLDYVLTSQQLWGDYETIKHLAISELYHPVGSKVVSVIKYKWDGLSRTKIDNVKEYAK